MVISAGTESREKVARALKSCRDIMRKDKGMSSDVERLPQLTWLLFLKFLDDLELQDEELALLGGESYEPIIPVGYRWRDWATKPSPTGAELMLFVSADEVVRNGTRQQGLIAKLRQLDSSRSGRHEVVARVFGGVSNRMSNGYLLKDVLIKLDQIDFASSEDLHTLSVIYESILREVRDAAGNSGEFYTPRPLVRALVEAVDPRLGETVLDPACGTAGFLVEAFEHIAGQVRTAEDRRTLQRSTLFGGEAKDLPYLLAEMNLLLHGVEVPNIQKGNSLAVRLGEIGEAERFDVIVTNPPFGGEEESGIRDGFPPGLRTAETTLLFLQLIMRKLRRRSRGDLPARAAVVVPNGTLYEAGVAQRIREILITEFRLDAVLRLPKGVFEPYTDLQTNVLFFSVGEPVEEVRFYEHPLPEHRSHLKGKTYSATDGLKYEELTPFLRWFRDGESSEHGWTVAVDVLKDRGFDLALNRPKRDLPERPTATSIRAALPQRMDRLRVAVDEISAELRKVAHNPSPHRSLASLLERRTEKLLLQPEEEYMRARVQLHFRGAVLRDRLAGARIGTKSQTRMYAGDIILSRIDARNGAMAIVPEELAGAIATGDFPVFSINRNIVDPDYLRFALFQPEMLVRYEEASRGSTNRRRLDMNSFLQMQIPVPVTIEEQLEVRDLLRHVQDLVRETRESIGDLDSQVALIMPSVLHETFTVGL